MRARKKSRPLRLLKNCWPKLNRSRRALCSPNTHHASAHMPSTLKLNAAVLAACDDLSLLARTVVEGFMDGLHRSPFLGYSTEFSSYRPYTQGDNLRHIDWKVWGRTDELYVKQFEDDTNLYSQILLDTSGSMDFGNPNKFQY